MSDSWFVTQVFRAQAPAQLFCFPHAGGGSSGYREWPRLLGPDVEVHAFIPPARERRLSDRAVLDPVAVAAAVALRADRPFALFGHSMGGVLAFEVARALRRSGAGLPSRLFVSGCAPPDLGRFGAPFEGASRLADDELLALVAEHGDLPPEILADEQLVGLLLPAFRADFTWLDAYEYADEPPLPTPITVFAGDEDVEAPAERMDGWKRHTDAGHELHTLPGGHTFPQLHPTVLAGLIRSGLCR